MYLAAICNLDAMRQNREKPPQSRLEQSRQLRNAIHFCNPGYHQHIAT